MTFGKLLAAHLHRRGLSQSQFAREVNTAQAFISQIIRGARTPPLDRLETWAKHLQLDGVDRSEFIHLGRLAHAPEALRLALDDDAPCSKWSRYLLQIGLNELYSLRQPLLDEVQRALDDPAILLSQAEILGKRVIEELRSLPDRPNPIPQYDPLARLWGKQKEMASLADELTTTKQLLAKANEEIARQQQDILALSRQLADMRQQLERQNPQPTT